jgi:hypothetical protein
MCGTRKAKWWPAMKTILCGAQLLIAPDGATVKRAFENRAVGYYATYTCIHVLLFSG